MICDHPQCTGKHGHKGPMSERCPVSIALKKATDRSYYIANKERLYAYQRQWRADHPSAWRAYCTRYNVTAKGLLNSCRQAAKNRMMRYETTN